jgi:hypothetical protein
MNIKVAVNPDAPTFSLLFNTSGSSWKPSGGFMYYLIEAAAQRGGACLFYIQQKFKNV